MKALAALALVACSPKAAVTQSSAALTGAPTVECEDIRDHGATESADATTAIQAAINAPSGYPVCIPPGTWTVSASLEMRPGLYVSGGGAGSVLQLAATTYSNDVNMLNLLDDDGVAIERLTLDGNRNNIVNGGLHQIHCVQVRESAGVIFRDVTFTNCYDDGIKAFGEVADPADGMLVTNCLFVGCGRSGIAVQRNVVGARITNNRFVDISDQSIDFEPSGAGAPRNNLIAHNVFDNEQGTASTGIVVTLSGISPSDLSDGITFTDNTIRNGRIHAVHTKRLLIHGNTIDGAAGAPAVELSRTCELGLVADNIVTSPDGVGVSVKATSATLRPLHTGVRGNAISAATNGIVVWGGQGVRITGNAVAHNGNGSAGKGVEVRGNVAGTEGALISGNAVDGFPVAISVLNTPYTVGGVVATDNLVNEGNGWQ